MHKPFTMHGMAKKKPGPKPDGPKRIPMQLRLHPLLRQQLEKLVELNASDLTAELSIALRERLERFNLWPPKPGQ